MHELNVSSPQGMLP